MYYVAKQAERKWGVYYQLLGHSKEESMHSTRKAAKARAMLLNEVHRQLNQKEA